MPLNYSLQARDWASICDIESAAEITPVNLCASANLFGQWVKKTYSIVMSFILQESHDILSLFGTHSSLKIDQVEGFSQFRSILL